MNKRWLTLWAAGFTAGCALLPVVGLAVLHAEEQSKYLFWSAAELAKVDKKLQGSMKSSKGADEILMKDKTYFMMFHREGSAPKAEIHKMLGDFGVVRSGAGAVLTGGKFVNEKVTAPDEVRGDIEGGTKQQLAPGDVFYVPSNTPHQILVAPGDHLDVVVLKVAQRNGKSDVPQFMFWSAGQMRDRAEKLKLKMDKFYNAVDQVVNTETVVAMENHKEGTAESEIHEHLEEFQVIQTGEGAIMLGGKVVNARVTDPGEVRGTALEGATRQSLMPGNLLYIPANMPHFTLVERGKSQNKLVIKVWSRD